MSRLRTLAAVAVLALLAACDSTTSPLQLDPSFAKEGGGAIKVDSTDPTSAPQDTTLEVRILGSGFEPGSKAAFLLNGAADPRIATGRTRFVSDTELVAEVTITLDAEVALYDVEVTDSRGRRRGVGTELFAVVEKTNPGGPTEGNVITTFDDSSDMGWTSDGGGSYVPWSKGQRGLRSEIQNGQHTFGLGDRSGREVCWTFPAGDDALILSEADWSDLLAISGGAVDLGNRYCGSTDMHTREHTDPGNLLDMDTDPSTAVDDVQSAGGKMMLLEFGTEGAWEWRLSFDDYRTEVNSGSRTNGVCVRKNPDDTWTIANDPTLDDSSENPDECDSVDEWVNLLRVTAGDGAPVFTHVARFRMPFRYTVTPIF